MRLSATDRIIREAERDSAAVEVRLDEHLDTEKVTAGPMLSLGFPSPRMPTPLGGGIDIAFHDDDDRKGDDGHDDGEGDTQVDAKRSAAALDQMRALQAGSLTPPPVLVRTSNPEGAPPPGRPRGTARIGLAPLMPLGPGLSPQTTLLFGAAAFRVTPTPSADPAPAAPPNTSALDQPSSGLDVATSGQVFSAPGPEIGAASLPPSFAATAEPPSPADGVGRRAGFAIAAGTALAVMLIVGAWTTGNIPPLVGLIARRWGEPARVGKAPVRSSSQTTHAAVAQGRGPIPKPVMAVSTPAAPVPVRPPVPARPAPPPAPPAPAGNDGADSGALRSTRAQPTAKSAKLSKSRLAKKKGSASRRSAVVGAPPRAAKGASPAGHAASGTAPALRGRADPDDTLPITY